MTWQLMKHEDSGLSWILLDWTRTKTEYDPDTVIVLGASTSYFQALDFVIPQHTFGRGYAHERISLTDFTLFSACCNVLAMTLYSICAFISLLEAKGNKVGGKSAGISNTKYAR